MEGDKGARTTPLREERSVIPVHLNLLKPGRKKRKSAVMSLPGDELKVD